MANHKTKLLCVCVCVCVCAAPYPQLDFCLKHFIHQASFGSSLFLGNNNALLKQEYPSLWFLQFSLNGEQVTLTTDLAQLGDPSLQEGREISGAHEGEGWGP